MQVLQVLTQECCRDAGVQVCRDAGVAGVAGVAGTQGEECCRDAGVAGVDAGVLQGRRCAGVQGRRGRSVVQHARVKTCTKMRVRVES